MNPKPTSFDDISMSHPLIASADALFALEGVVPPAELMQLTSGAEEVETEEFIDLCVKVEDNPKIYGVPESLAWGDRAQWAILNAHQLIAQHPDLAPLERARAFCIRMRDLVTSRLGNDQAKAQPTLLN